MALQLASARPQKVYIATAEALDDEMKLKIKLHKAERDTSYCTVEEPLDLCAALVATQTLAAQGDIIIVDCLTMWVNNLVYYQKDVQASFAQLCELLPSLSTDIVLITNESSLCLIAGDKESRRYQASLAELNRLVAVIADRVCLMVSGLPLWLKGEG
jgi:adenosylcobinamide kinase/adenosylcobinamide-phosphate guanylyltransferase